ncbi:MAG: hydrogenase maturation protease [Elusimicrobia bacterium]|nr:hydrogenase maturation protease [Elusimicrobiota bacterium]
MRYLIGVGTYAAFDDSIGLRIVERIAEGGLERGFRAIDLSGNMVNLLNYLEKDSEHILIVDSAKMGRKAGDYEFFRPEDVETRKQLAGFSTHEGDLLKVLEFARELKYRIPPITLMGIEPETVKSEMGLSAALQARLDEYAEAAIRRCLGPS